MTYETILFDLDHTLLDSDESERRAYAHTASQAGLDDPDAHFPRYVTINRQMWQAVERGELDPTEVRFRRFEQFNAEIGLDADPAVMAEHFVWALGPRRSGAPRPRGLRGSRGEDGVGRSPQACYRLGTPCGLFPFLTSSPCLSRYRSCVKNINKYTKPVFIIS